MTTGTSRLGLIRVKKARPIELLSAAIQSNLSYTDFNLRYSYYVTKVQRKVTKCYSLVMSEHHRHDSWTP